MRSRRENKPPEYWFRRTDKERRGPGRNSQRQDTGQPLKSDDEAGGENERATEQPARHTDETMKVPTDFGPREGDFTSEPS